MNYRYNLKKGDFILLVYPPSIDFIISFIACLKAGIIAIPMFPPNPLRLDKGIKLFHTVIKECKTKYALTSSLYNFSSTISTIKVLFILIIVLIVFILIISQLIV